MEGWRVSRHCKCVSSPVSLVYDILMTPYVFTVTCVETSLSILLDFDKLPKLGQEGGVLTPMSALGDVLVERLERTGRFEQRSEIVVDAERGNKKRV